MVVMSCSEVAEREDRKEKWNKRGSANWVHRILATLLHSRALAASFAEQLQLCPFEYMSEVCSDKENVLRG